MYNIKQFIFCQNNYYLNDPSFISTKDNYIHFKSENLQDLQINI